MKITTTHEFSVARHLFVLCTTTLVALGASLQPVTASPKSQPSQSSSMMQGSFSHTMPVLRLGSRGAEVKRLQALLKTAKVYAGLVDGVFGTNTKASVISFQKAKGLSADGVVGAKTWAALHG